MTREEIAKSLNILKEQALKSHNDTAILNVKVENFVWVIEMAIQALSQEPCDDAVSREAVLKEFEKGTENLYGRIDKLPSVNLQPCDDAISREWLMRKATERFYTTNYFNHISAMIEEAPPVTQKSGKWIKKEDDTCWWYACSECGQEPLQNRWNDDDVLSSFCPNCGAKMVEPQKKQCAECNHYGKLSLDCGRCDDDCSMFEPQESEE